jgi:hypothetical protein
VPVGLVGVTAIAGGFSHSRQVAKMVHPRIAALPAEKPFYGLCHRDVGSAKAHVTANGQITLSISICVGQGGGHTMVAHF